MKILLAEDDSKLSKMLVYLLKKEMHSVDAVDNGNDAIEYIKLTDYDVVLLDWMMPQKSGIDVCKYIRSHDNNCGILLLTAKDTLDDKILGLDSGADDYIVKPFEILELLARIRAIKRRQPKAFVSDIIDLNNGLSINKTTFTAAYKNSDLSLTKREYQLLELLIENKNITMPRAQIIDYIWNTEDSISSNALDALIKLLRKKLTDAGSSNIIKTIHGIGYRIED
ncbi:response regulator transcription factor [Pectinatus brassicae]|uniref:DNA-binding response OmpR family regulator n=1 Tax=Pectinatus brassicae TaxID=862415 RepID=A0A840ULI3_9FIRM|nr:response regulator transcription factor [Pectinatus brassicae]MBB5335102.1 DNA-binding response OmpR family regulator [Pectinatus brassicae]